MGNDFKPSDFDSAQSSDQWWASQGAASSAASFTPSIKLEHADSRGEIYSIELPDGQELMLIHSTPGSFRGGHSHSCDEVVMMLSGRMRYYKEHDCFSMVEGAVSHNEADLNHMGEFLEDSWLVEYKFAKKGQWTQTNFEPMREKVHASNRI